MHKVERKKLYIKELEKHSFILSTEFIEQFELQGINSATIRRDLKELETAGIVTLTFGGINVNIGQNNQKPLKEEESHNLEVKEKIAKKANELLADGDMIYCGAGTTMETFACNIIKQIRLLVTNSLRVLQKSINNPNIKDVVLMGGLFRQKSQVFLPQKAGQYFQEFKIHKAFYSAIAYDELGNVFDDYLPENNVIKIAIENAEQNYLLVDASKAKNYASKPIINMVDISGIVIDQNVSPDLLKKFNNIIITE